MNTIGETVKSARMQCGLKQKEFGATLTVSQSYICKIEKGLEIPTPMFIKLFCVLYKEDEKQFAK